MAFGLTSSQEAALREVAAVLRVSPDWLARLIAFESAWKPDAENPSNGAKGLIQFTNSTARSMGFLSAHDLYEHYPTVETQLRGPVLKYLKPKGPFPTEQALQQAVFFPVAKLVPPDTTYEALFKKVYPDTWSTRFDTFKKQNPGILRVSDYTAHVARQVVKLGSPTSLAALGIGAAALYFLTR